MTTDTATAELATRFVELTHMHDWIWNEERQRIAAELHLAHPWRSHAAYLEAHALTGSAS